MKKITNKALKTIGIGTRLYDTISHKQVMVNAIEFNYYIVDLLMKDSETLKKNYMLVR